jgi:hypothetical protein
MKNKLFAIFAVFALFLALGSMASASGPVIIFQDDFSSDALAANYSTQGVNYNATPETVTIARGYSGGGNYLEVAQSFDLDTGGSTQLTIAFDYAFGTAMNGSGFTVEYNDNSGTGWQVIDTIAYTGTNADNDGIAANSYTVTISEGATYNFTDGATIRIIGNTSQGGKGYHIDNLTISVDQMGASSKGTVIMISGVSGWFVLIFGFLIRKETQRHNVVKK